MGEIIFLVIDGGPLHLEASESLGMQRQQHPVILIAMNTHHGLKKIPKESIIPPHLRTMELFRGKIMF